MLKLKFLWNTLWGKIIMTFFISMVPIIELRGTIPIALANGLNFWVTLIVAIIGNLVPVPFIIIFINKIFGWMRLKSDKLSTMINNIEDKARRKSDVVNKYAFWGLVILVAIPLPGTGAWTGALIAAMLQMKFKNAFFAIAIGVISAGLIVAFITYGIGSIIRM